MTSVAHYLSKVALLALAYYVTGRLGLLLAVPPGYATAIWPPSGFALAGILLMGYRYWPGVLLGSFAVNLFTSFDPSNASSMLTSGGIAAIIAGGATLQAIVSAWLCRRWIVFPNVLEQTRDIALLLALGGPVGCLVNSLIGVGTLTAFGLIPLEESPFNWLTWWTGNLIGVLIFTPLTLLLGSAEGQVGGRRKAMVGLALATTLTIAIEAFMSVRASEHERQHLLLEEEAVEISTRLNDRLLSLSEAVYSVSLLYNSSQSVTREEFQTFASGVLDNHPGMSALTWAPQIVGKRATHYPIAYTVPYLTTLEGFDYASAYKSTLWSARDRGEMEATARIDIVDGGKKSYGLLIFQPVYRNDHRALTVEGRRESIKGFVAGTLVLSDVIGAGVKSLSDMDLYITDDEAPANKRLLYDSRTEDHMEGRRALRTVSRDMQWHVRIRVAGRHWTIHCVQRQAALLAHQNWTVWLVLAGGLLFTGLFGVFVMVVTARTDIVRRLVEQRTHQLMESEATFRLAMEHASIGMALVDPSGRWLKVNNALCELIGYSELELMQMDFQTITHPEDLEADLDSVRQMLAGSIQTYQMEKRYLHKDGRIIWALLSVSLVHNVDGSPKYFISQIQDITQRKEMDRMKGEFISTVSHELRTPLTSIAGSLGLLAGGVAGELPPKVLQLVGIAEQNSQRLVRLINDILDIEKAAAGKLEYQLEVQPLGPIVLQAVEANRGYAQKCNVRFVPHQPLPQVRVRVDAHRISQVMANLLSNAAKFSPPDSIVEIGLTADAFKSRVFVKDCGPGIPEEFRARIFQRFTQADGSDRRAKGGTGLGLAISKALIEQMGGTIGYESARGSGTTFFFELPVVGG